jgi:predicted nucleotidyltransferase
MRLEHYPVEKLKREILEIIEKHLDSRRYRIFFFGSRVAGTGTERSDIDVGIEGPPIPGLAWLEIQEAVENLPVLYKIDIVDFSEVAPIFREVALQYVEPLTSPENV